VTARYAAGRAFPAYAYLPGRDRHPTQHPEGHSYRGDGVPEAAAAYFAPEAWGENSDYLFGVDLYNHGYLWEAHEVWEGLWHAAKHDAVQADFLQGLIQCAAAALKIPMEQPGGLAKLAERGTSRLDSVARRAGPEYMGLDVHGFVREFRAFAAASPRSADERPRLELS
jgi:hypothetical protein